MAYLSALVEHSTMPVNTQQFLGLNMALRGNDGEMADMTNLTGKYFPLLASRDPRGMVTTLTEPMGLMAKEQLAWVAKDTDGTMRLWYGAEKIGGLMLSKSGPKQMVSMGAYICIWPDKVYFNTVDRTDYGHMELHEQLTAGIKMTVSMCRLDGTDYDTSNFDYGAKAPSDPTVGQFWMDTGTSPHTLMQYSGSDWVQVATTYIKLKCEDRPEWAKDIREYDVVNIAGLVNAYDGKEADIRDQLAFLETSAIVYQTGDKYIVIAGVIDRAVRLTVGTGESIRFDRDVPDCDFITENNNRLWGCKYGMRNGAVVNEIFACKLGDFRNWNVFMGLSTDSYIVSVGTDGPFTGAATLRGYPLFFKEDCIHRVGGDRPSSFTMQTTMCRGVEKGSERSICIVDEALIYKSRTDIMRYDGASVVGISDAFAGKVYHNAVAGAHGSKYYVSMQDEAGGWHLLVFDGKRGLWHREDDTQAIMLADLDDELYLLRADGAVIAMYGTEGEQEGMVPWSATFCVDGYEYEAQKYLKRYNLRMSMEKGAEVTLYIQYNGDGHWIKMGTMHGRDTTTFLLPVVPHRCDHLQVKLEGKGQVRIYSLARVLEIGGDGGVNRH